MGPEVFPEVYFAKSGDAENGLVQVQYLDLYPGLAERPTDALMDGRGFPYHVLNILVVGPHRFIPVYPGMWLGVRPHWNNNSGLMTPVTMRASENGFEAHMWRRKRNDWVTDHPSAISEEFSWEVRPYGYGTFAHFVDRAMRDDPTRGQDPTRGLYEPFIVQPTGFGRPKLGSYPFDEITVWYRQQRMPEGSLPKAADGEHPIASGKYAKQAAVASRVGLIWRDTAEKILRAASAVKPDQPIEWAWTTN